MPKCLTYFVSDGYRKWSAHDVELALWSFHFAKMLQPELLESVETESSSCSSEPTDHEPKRRKRANKECVLTVKLVRTRRMIKSALRKQQRKENNDPTISLTLPQIIL